MRMTYSEVQKIIDDLKECLDLHEQNGHIEVSKKKFNNLIDVFEKLQEECDPICIGDCEFCMYNDDGICRVWNAALDIPEYVYPPEIKKSKRKYVLSLKQQGYDTKFDHLWKIKAKKDFANIKKGDIGGYIQSDDNLSHEGNAWVGGPYGRVFGHAQVSDNAQVLDDAAVYGYAEVAHDAIVSDHASVYDHALVFENAKVCGDVRVCGQARIRGNALLSKQRHYFCVGPVGKLDNYLTVYRGEDGKAYVVNGADSYSLEEFEAMVHKKICWDSLWG